MNGQLTTMTQLADAPADMTRERVVHVTSRGESSDYVAAGIDLRDASLTLPAAAEDGTIAYDYYKGSDVTHRVLDEVFVLLRTGPTEFALAVRGKDADQPETWETRDVSSELADDSWLTAQADIRQLNPGAVQRQITTGEVDDIETVAQDLAGVDDLETVSDLTSQFDDADVLAMAIGVGALNGAVTDAYYADLQVGDTSCPIPAVIPMEVSFSGPQGRGSGRLTATLSLSIDQAGLNIADIDAETAKLAPYTNVAPPVPIVGRQNAITPDAVSQSDGDRVTLEFVPGQVQQLLAQRDASQVVVYGAFEGENPDMFAAVGTVEEAGRGSR
ncbi:hypothetical protein [Natrinema sp. H-ect4]|uniref:hypothetical protein n=1 Tax=Natrinema sp. H-ect4 TaxID=3242699 RepID=UPI0035A8B95E